jgi:hypothetical protein
MALEIRQVLPRFFAWLRGVAAPETSDFLAIFTRKAFYYNKKNPLRATVGAVKSRKIAATGQDFARNG